MNLVIKTVIDEKKRIEIMIEKYNSLLNEFPKGNIYERNIGGKTYFYLKYRDKDKIVSKYVSLNNIENVRKKIDKRKHIELMIDSLNDELVIVNKMLGGITK